MCSAVFFTSFTKKHTQNKAFSFHGSHPTTPPSLGTSTPCSSWVRPCSCAPHPPCCGSPAETKAAWAVPRVRGVPPAAQHVSSLTHTAVFAHYSCPCLIARPAYHFTFKSQSA